MKILINRKIKLFFCWELLFITVYTLLSTAFIGLKTGNAASYILAASLCMSISLLVTAYLYFREQNKIMEDAVTQIRAYISGNQNARIECNNEGELYRLFHEVNSLVSILNAHAENAGKEKRFLKDTISDISHQLKTPMTTLRLTESAMEKAITKPQELKTLFHTNTAHLNKLEFLISSLVKISRLETGVIKLSPSYQTIGDTILMALENIVLAADQKNIQITFNYSEDFKAYHDPKWTSEALYNILDNAVKYTNENGHISIELFTLENYTKIAITDSGIGIKESEIPKLFQRFYRSPSVKNFPGVGVGLHLAQDIISRQYGFIHVLSTLHVGSTFEVWLINSDSPK